jgi:putative transposase
MRDRVDKHPKLAGAVAREHSVPLELFLSVLDEQMNAIRIKSGRRAKNCAGRSFWATFEEGLKTVAVRKATDQQKRLFLLAVQNVVISARDGSFKLAGDNRYSLDVADQADLAGQKVTIRFDPQRLREPVHVYRLSGEYVGPATCILPVGFNSTQGAREQARLKRRHVKYHLAILDNERRMKLGEVTPLLPDATPATGLIDSKVVKLFQPQIEQPNGVRTNDLPSRRRAEFERLSRIPKAELTVEQVRWLAVYEKFGDDIGFGIGRSA